MKIGTVVGRVTLNHHLDCYRGGRFFLVLPADRAFLESNGTTPLPHGNSAVVYDALGADIGDLIAFSEGGEASMPFAEDTPVDAYNCMILDSIHYSPSAIGDTP